jgi:hypothetical protein
LTHQRFQNKRVKRQEYFAKFPEFVIQKINSLLFYLVGRATRPIYFRWDCWKGSQLHDPASNPIVFGEFDEERNECTHLGRLQDSLEESEQITTWRQHDPMAGWQQRQYIAATCDGESRQIAGCPCRETPRRMGDTLILAALNGNNRLSNREIRRN